MKTAMALILIGAAFATGAAGMALSAQTGQALSEITFYVA